MKKNLIIISFVIIIILIGFYINHFFLKNTSLEELNEKIEKENINNFPKTINEKKELLNQLKNTTDTQYTEKEQLEFLDQLNDSNTTADNFFKTQKDSQLTEAEQLEFLRQMKK